MFFKNRFDKVDIVFFGVFYVFYLYTFIKTTEAEVLLSVFSSILAIISTNRLNTKTIDPKASPALSQRPQQSFISIQEHQAFDAFRLQAQSLLVY